MSVASLSDRPLANGYKTAPTGPVPSPAGWRGVAARLQTLRAGGWWRRESAPRTEKLPQGTFAGEAIAPQRSAASDDGQALSAAPRSTAKQSLGLAAATFGVATAGTFVYPPLHLACVPLLLALGVKATQTTYQSWRQERRAPLALAESAVVALCLVHGSFVAGSLGLSLYYLGQVVADERRKQKQSHTDWQPPLWAWRQEGAGEKVTPVSRLQVGDALVVHAGEMTPLAGVVTSGTAWVRTQGQPAPLGVKVSTGHQVEAAAIVVAGAITVVVTTVRQA